MESLSLHSNILENILFRLPAETALHAKRVCPTWRATLRKKIGNPGFVFSHGHGVRLQLFYGDEYDHYDHAKMDYYNSYNTLTKIEHDRFITSSIDVMMVGSCNGLLCLGEDNEDLLGKGDVLGADPFLICNPLTGESVVLPEYNYSELPLVVSNTRLRLASGFGFCPSTNDYKVVTVYYHHDEHKGHVQVYTVGGKWRYIGSTDRYRFQDSLGIYANGALHWLHQNEIASFDLEGHKFYSIPLPASKDFENRTDYLAEKSLLKLLGGNNNLYLVHTDFRDDFRASCIDIWVYKRNKRNSGTSCAIEVCNRKQNNHYKSASCWIKEFSIDLEKPDCYIPFAITRSNEVLLWYKCFGTRLYCYDPKTSTLNKLWGDKANGADCSYIEAIPHTKSMISLKDFGETNITSLKEFCQTTEAENGSEFLEKSIRPRGAKRKKSY